VSEAYGAFKIYMTYDDLKLNDREMLDLLAVAKVQGALVMVHAESSDCIAWLTDRLTGELRIQPRYHAAARPPVVEREATHRAISLAELVDVPILIVHVSGREAIEQIRWAQARGLNILAETCPQYLYLTAADLAGDHYDTKAQSASAARRRARRPIRKRSGAGWPRASSACFHRTTRRFLTTIFTARN
jgi:dihydropyrimidinase